MSNLNKALNIADLKLNEFTVETTCVYMGEIYSVRSNGAVLRHARKNKRRRSKDNQWSFGTEIPSNDYLHFSSIRVHRIVAEAFLGRQPGPNYIVDHIDSNHKNNMPVNLKWVTRLENAVINPKSRKHRF